MPRTHATFRFGFAYALTLWFLVLALIVWLSQPFIALVFSASSFAALWIWNALQAQRMQHALANLDAPLQAIPTAPGLWGELFYALFKRVRNWQTELTQVQEQEQSFMQAIQASPNAFVMLDDAARVLWVNQAAQHLLGLDASRDIGQNLAYLLRTQAVLALLDSQRLREPVMIRTPDKSVQVQAFPYGEAHTLLLGQDVTQLERTDQVRRDFVANVSHELRTPLTVLTGYNELLQDYLSEHPNQLPEALQEALSQMATHTHRMNALTQDLLQLAALEAPANLASGEMAKSDSRPLRAVEWFERVETSFKGLTNQATIVFTKPQANLMLMGNATELDSALSNLVSNALRYTPSSGAVTVYCELSAGCCEVTVQDTGCGIAVAHIPRLTERFYRVSASRSRESGGTGLGLAIVKHIMLRHDGELKIRSELGQGSAFTLRLPLASAA